MGSPLWWYVGPPVDFKAWQGFPQVSQAWWGVATEDDKSSVLACFLLFPEDEVVRTGKADCA